LIARGEVTAIVVAALSGALGSMLMAAAFFGRFGSRLDPLVRALCLAAGVLLLAPSVLLLPVGLAAAALAYGLHRLTLPRRAGLSPE
jgi:TRAP-type uncharacterized transport system fused permease subunit